MHISRVWFIKSTTATGSFIQNKQFNAIHIENDGQALEKKKSIYNIYKTKNGASC